MKRIFIISCVLILSHAVFGQQIKIKNVELDDVITLLKASGYELFSYDITEMLDERYDITLVEKEFEAGKEIETSDLVTLSNKRLLTDFPEASRQEAIDAGVSIIDPETQAIAHAGKISLGFYPSDNDSTKFMQFSVQNSGRMEMPLKLRGLTTKDPDKKYFSYHTRPFKTVAFEEEKFIPLVLFGSAWYEERFNTYRFCGDSEIEPDMSSEILKDLPHYYVIGVKFVKKK